MDCRSAHADTIKWDFKCSRVYLNIDTKTVRIPERYSLGSVSAFRRCFAPSPLSIQNCRLISLFTFPNCGFRGEVFLVQELVGTRLRKMQYWGAKSRSMNPLMNILWQILLALETNCGHLTSTSCLQKWHADWQLLIGGYEVIYCAGHNSLELNQLLQHGSE